MDPIEQRVRESLHTRAEDVEPTPHLYRDVQERIGRRQRLRVAAWSLAGVAAVAAAVVIVPNLVGGLDQRTPEVAETPDPVESPEAEPLGPGEPTHALLAFDDGVIDVVDLADSSRHPLSGAEGADVSVTQLVAAPGGSAERFRAVAVKDRGDEPATVEVTERTGRGTATSVTPTTNLPGGGSGMPPSIAISADGEWLAYTGISQDVDAARVVYAVPIDPDDATLDVAAATEVHTVTGPEPPGVLRELLDWTGPTRVDGDVSRLVLDTPAPEVLTLERNGEALTVTAAGLLTDAYPGAVAIGGTGTVDVSSSFLDADLDTAPAHRLTAREDGELELAFEGTASVVRERFEANDEVRLDARGRTALLVGEGRAVTVRYREVGMERGPVPAPEVTGIAEGVTAGALLGGAALSADDPEGESVEEDKQAPERPSAGPLGDGLVVADDTTVSLVRPDGSQQELVSFPQEGESTVVDVAVRPGSTADDLTVAITTRGEGTFDVRWLRAIDGQAPGFNVGFPAPPIGSASPDGIGGFPVTAPDLQDGGEMNVAWSPDGDLLAVFVRPAPGEPAEVRTIGWDDDGPSEDGDLAATFTLETDAPLILRGWSWTETEPIHGVAREGQLLLVDRMAREAFTVRLDRQGDGAPSMPNANPLLGVEQGRTGEVLDLADADGDATVDTWLGLGDPHPILHRERQAPSEDGATGWAVEIDAIGPRDVSFVVTSPQVILVALDPAQPVLVDPQTGDVRPAPIDGEVVSADLIR